MGEENSKKMVTFADDDWFRGMICSMVALGSILVGYAVYYGVLLPRWPDFDPEYDEDDEEDALTGKANEAFASQDKPTEVAAYSETKVDEQEIEQEEEL